MLLEKEDEQTVLITLYVMIDDLLKVHQQFFGRLRLPGRSPRGRPGSLSLSHWLTLGLFRYALRIEDVKHYWRHIRSHYPKDFPGLPNYQNFVLQINRTTPYVILLLQWILHLNRQKATMPYSVDATPLKVCENRRIPSHKVCRGLAQRGKTTMGWFFGFKLHTVVDSLGRMLSLLITPGNTDDRKFLLKLFKGLKGIGIGDSAYLSKKLLRDLWQQGIHFFTDVKKHMKRLMTVWQHELLKLRQRIEITFSVLKYRLQQAVSVARSPLGYFSRWLYACLSYVIFNMLESQESQPMLLS